MVLDDMTKDDWKGKYYPCRTCAKEGKGVKATVCYRPDLDLQGLCYCDKHEKEGFIEYLTLHGYSKYLKKP